MGRGPNSVPLESLGAVARMAGVRVEIPKAAPIRYRSPTFFFDPRLYHMKASDHGMNLLDTRNSPRPASGIQSPRWLLEEVTTRPGFTA